MKNKLLLLTLALLLFSIVPAQAGFPSPPYTFVGEFNIFEEPCDNCEIQFRYLDSREDKTWKKTVTSEGWYQFTNKQFSDGDFYRPGDRIEVKFCNDNVKSACLQIIKFGDGAGTWTNIQIEENSDYDLISNKGNTIIIITDQDAAKEVIVVGPDDKPLIKEIKVCEDGTEPIDDKCPADIWDWIFKACIGILAAFGFGAGLCGLARYYWNKGKEQIRLGKKIGGMEGKTLIAKGKKNRSRACKMLTTALRRAVLGQYDRYKKED